MKYKLNQTIYYMMDNRVHSAKIFARMKVENTNEDSAVTIEQKSFFTPFGSAAVKYATTHGIILEEEAHASKEELLENL